MEEEIKYFDFSKEPGKILNNNNPVIDEFKPLISILTAYYNAKEYIEQTANCIFNQTFPYWEWIIIDDGSTEPETKEFLDELAKKDKRIKILRKANGGCSSARYYGAKHAEADILYILDADDLIDETLLECGYWTLQNNPEAMWAYSNIVGFGTLQYLWNKFFKVSLEKKENILVISAFIRKKALLDFKEYENLENDIYEDWYLWMNFLKKGYYPVRMNFYGFWYRRLNKSMLSGIRKDKKKHLYAISKIKKVAKYVSNDIAAIQFPDLSYKNNFDETEMLKWDKQIKYRYNKINLLFIFPQLTESYINKFNFDLVKGLDKEKYQITIITTLPSEYILRQHFEKYATIFDLTTFLHKTEWADFICYLIKTRNIKLVFNSHSMYGYNVLPLIKTYFSNIPIVDCLHDEDMPWHNGKYFDESINASKILDRSYICTSLSKKLTIEKLSKKIKDMKIVHIKMNNDYFETNKTNLNNIISETLTPKFVQSFENEFEKLISSGSKISSGFKNINLAKKHLNKRCILDNDAAIYDYSSYYSKQLLRDRLWKIPAWRIFVKLCKKVHLNKIVNLIKKTNNKKSGELDEKK